MTFITIFVAYHDTLEDTNVFFTKRENAEQFIKKMNNAGISDDISEWSIIEIREGRTFGADMSLANVDHQHYDYFAYSEDLMYKNEREKQKQMYSNCLKELCIKK